MPYVIVKPCKISGVEHARGDTLDDAVIGTAARFLEPQGYVRYVEEAAGAKQQQPKQAGGDRNAGDAGGDDAGGGDGGSDNAKPVRRQFTPEERAERKRLADERKLERERRRDAKQRAPRPGRG